MRKSGDHFAYGSSKSIRLAARGSRLAIAGVSALGLALAVTACDEDPSAPAPAPDVAAGILELARATSRYHDLDAAIADGFVFVHECEVVDEGPVGMLYGHPDRIGDGALDPSLPDGLLYAPSANGPQLLGVEMAIPYALWTENEPPEFLGQPLREEDEFEPLASTSGSGATTRTGCSHLRTPMCPAASDGPRGPARCTVTGAIRPRTSMQI